MVGGRAEGKLGTVHWAQHCPVSGRRIVITCQTEYCIPRVMFYVQIGART